MVHAGRWYVAESGKAAGPFTLEVLKNRILRGDLRSSDYVCREGSKQWVRAKDVPEIVASVSSIVGVGSESRENESVTTVISTDAPPPGWARRSVPPKPLPHPPRPRASKRDTKGSSHPGAGTVRPAGKTRWFVRRGGMTFGPVSEDEVIAALKDGRLAHTDHACADGTEKWVALHSVPAFCTFIPPR